MFAFTAPTAFIFHVVKAWRALERTKMSVHNLKQKKRMEWSNSVQSILYNLVFLALHLCFPTILQHK